MIGTILLTQAFQVGLFIADTCFIFDLSTIHVSVMTLIYSAASAAACTYYIRTTLGEGSPLTYSSLLYLVY